MSEALRRTRDGRMLCTGHRRSGAPPIHTPGCAMCEAVRAAGVVRPDAATIPKRKRGRQAKRRRWINWNAVMARGAERMETTPEQMRAEQNGRAAQVEAFVQARAGR